ncbi:MAG: hypothetical protein K0U79_14425 [Gammaproteobacteria bacterium]|nr:hypothetical protein [Gammaproteobacteria bacterium]
MHLFDRLNDFVNGLSMLEWSIVGALVLLFVIYRWWDKVRFFALRLSYDFPLVGTLSRLSRDPSTAGDWFHSERQVCHDFYVFIEGTHSVSEYEKATDYLSKVGELGRSKLPLAGWILVSALVVVEALGFSYVLAGYTIPGASEQMQQMAAIGIAFMVSVLLVSLTHFTGREIHLNALVKKARSFWANSRDAAQSRRQLAVSGSAPLDKTFEDDHEPGYIQLLSRIPHNASVTPKWLITIMTALFVLIVAAGSTYVRGTVLELERIRETRDGSAVDAAFGAPSSQPSLPPELQSIEDQAAAAAQQDETRKDLQGGWATFVILAVIFIFLQIFGVLTGYFWGFASFDGAQATKIRGGHPTADSFVRAQERIVDYVSRIAQAKLSELQRRMKETTTNSLISTAEARTFAVFTEEELERRESARTSDEERTSRRAAARNKANLETRRSVADRPPRQAVSEAATGPNTSTPVEHSNNELADVDSETLARLQAEVELELANERSQEEKLKQEREQRIKQDLREKLRGNKT